MELPVLVIKLGSAVITNRQGNVDESVIAALAKEIAQLSGRYRMVLVSSGAVSCGKKYVRNFKGRLVERKAAAAVGNPILIGLYHHYFGQHGIAVAQALCERHHFSSRLQFLQLKETFSEFWRNNILPVVNENDLVSNVELKFSDNDELATLLALGFDAETLLICTSVGGLLNAAKEVIPNVAKIDDAVLRYITTEKSGSGLGGMLSKITFTRLATSMGIRVVLSGVPQDDSLTDSLSGKTGTTFQPQPSSLKARQKWLASGSITLGELIIDEGAGKALQLRKSLLAVGIKQVQGTFSQGEVVQLRNHENAIIGVAKIRMSAAELANNLAQKNAMAAHADDIVLF